MTSVDVIFGLGWLALVAAAVLFARWLRDW